MSQTATFSRFANLIGLPASARSAHPTNDDDSDWFLPYTGPYEAPTHARQYADQYVARRGREAEVEDRGRSRKSRPLSGESRMTDATRKTHSTRSPRPPPSTSFLSMDTGGIGESPMAKHVPPTHTTDRERRDNHRASFASFMTFGHQTRRSQLPPSATLSTFTFPRTPDTPKTRLRSDTLRTSNSFSGRPRSKSNIQQPTPTSPQIRPPSSSRVPEYIPLHPYARAYAAPQPPLSPVTPPRIHTFTPDPPRQVQRTKSSSKPLKPSLSTPNLRSPPSPAPKPLPPKLPLSLEAQTICDALIFPRPRFRAHVISPPSSPPGRYENWTEQRNRVPIPTAPREDLLQRVVREGKELERERAEWQQTATRSFANKRSRSLNRSRSRSLVRGERERDGSLSVKSGFELLAATAFSQGHTPTVSLSTSSGSGSHSHSRKASSAGTEAQHSRNGSLGQSASSRIKRAAQHSCTTPDDAYLSPGVEVASLKGALLSPETTKLRIRTEKDHEDAPFVDIAAPAPPEPAPSPSPVSPSVGIALSTPPIPPHAQLPPHPYAARPATPETPRVPRAGPHPSSPVVVGFPEGGNDLSNRHRRPPHSAGLPHPHATPAATAPSPPSPSIPLEQRMFAPGPSGVIREIMDSELGTPSVKSPIQSPRALTPRIDEPVVSEDLTRAFRRRSTDSGMGTSEGDHGGLVYEAPEALRRILSTRTPATSKAGLSGTSRTSLRVRRKPINVFDAEYSLNTPIGSTDNLPSPLPSIHPYAAAAYDPSTPRESNPATPTGETVPEPAQEQPAVHTPEQSQAQEVIVPTSNRSSHDFSPRTRASADDYEPYKDLFYRPGPGSASGSTFRTPSSEFRKFTPPDGEPSPSIGRNSLTEDELEGDETLQETPRRGKKVGGTRSNRTSHDDGDPNTVLSSPSPEPSTSASALRLSPTRPLQIPVSMDRHRSPRSAPSNTTAYHADIPEDVESRASTPNDENEYIDDDTLRLGRVGALFVPQPTPGESRRHSTQLSLVEGEDGNPSEPPPGDAHLSVPIISPFRHRHLSIPGSVGELVRTSFMTSTSGASISDFPSPPAHQDMTPAGASLLESYFPSPPDSPTMRAMRPRTQSFPTTHSNRTTFGGSEDITFTQLPPQDS